MFQGTPHVHTIKFRWFLRASFHLLCMYCVVSFLHVSSVFIEIITGCVITFSCIQETFTIAINVFYVMHKSTVYGIYLKWICQRKNYALIHCKEKHIWNLYATRNLWNMSAALSYKQEIFGYLFRNNPLKIAEWSVMNLMTAYHKIPWYFI